LPLELPPVLRSDVGPVAVGKFHARPDAVRDLLFIDRHLSICLRESSQTHRRVRRPFIRYSGAVITIDLANRDAPSPYCALFCIVGRVLQGLARVRRNFPHFIGRTACYFQSLDERFNHLIMRPKLEVPDQNFRNPFFRALILRSSSR
jgi:hypothetical protein